MELSKKKFYLAILSGFLLLIFLILLMSLIATVSENNFRISILLPILFFYYFTIPLKNLVPIIKPDYLIFVSLIPLLIIYFVLKNKIKNYFKVKNYDQKLLKNTNIAIFFRFFFKQISFVLISLGLASILFMLFFTIIKYINNHHVPVILFFLLILLLIPTGILLIIFILKKLINIKTNNLTPIQNKKLDLHILLALLSFFSIGFMIYAMAFLGGLGGY